jgi:hypothetical protein
MREFFNMQYFRFRSLLAIFFLIFILSIIVVGMATNGTYDLFSPSFLWKAYNYYFLGILDGTLDVPVEAIGKEGAYYNSKAYMYYGALSILPRLFLYPFVDLTQTPASYFSIIFFTVLGHGALQISLISVVLKQKAAGNFAVNCLTLFTVSCLLWFGSASFMISQNATIYHEPYSAALCLVNIYLALLIKDRFFLSAHSKPNLLPYAILAGLCIHARMPTAVALYLVTGLLVLLQAYRARSAKALTTSPQALVWQCLCSSWPIILVLAGFGVSILILNYLKFDDPLRFMGMNYGYQFLEGFTDRRCNIVPTSEFSGLLRIIANGYVYLTGDGYGHSTLTWHLATGFGRQEFPLVPLAYLWPLPIACFCYVLWGLIKGFGSKENKIILIFLIAFSFGAVFQLKYPTITHRYSAEIWVPLFVCVIFLWFRSANNPLFLKPGNIIEKITYGTGALLVILGISYQLNLALNNRYYLQDGPITEHENYHYANEDNQFLKSLNPTKIKELQAQSKKERELKCAELAEKSEVYKRFKEK